MADLNRRCRTEGADADEISRIIAARREEEGYTGYLFREGLDKLLKKVGEAVGLMLLAAKNADSDDIALQAGGLFFHLLAAMQCTAVNNELLADELERRGNRVGNLKQFHITDHST